MPFPMKVQPVVDSIGAKSSGEAAKSLGSKSRLRKLFDRRQFAGVPKIAASVKVKLDGSNFNGQERDENGGGISDTEPSSLCLANMVQNFIEEANEKPSKCGRRRCSCFNSISADISDDELELVAVNGDQPFPSVASDDAADALRNLAACASVSERNLLAEASRILEKNKNIKETDDFKQILASELRFLGYDAAICKSRWEKTPSIPSGEHEFIDVLVKEERLLVEVDFRSEFEVARPTKAYRAALQSVPAIFVGSSDRLLRIVAVVSEAARVSLGKKGLHFPPWRKQEYMASKWIAPYQRSTCTYLGTEVVPSISDEDPIDSKSTPATEDTVAPPWKPPALKPKAPPAGVSKVVAGLASVLGNANRG